MEFIFAVLPGKFKNFDMFSFSMKLLNVEGLRVTGSVLVLWTH